MDRKYITLILFLASVLLFLIGFEIALRFLIPVTPQIGRDYIPRFLFQNDADLGFKHTPGFNGGMKTDEFDIAISINKHSLRGNEINVSTIKKRILFLGDSFIFGFGVENKDTLPSQLAYMLKTASMDDYEVINAGVMGYGTDQEIDYLKKEGLKLKPNLVVVGFFAGNDLSDNADYSNITVYNGFLVRDYNIIDNKNPFIWLFLKQKINAIVYRFNQAFFLKKDPTPKTKPQAYQIYSYFNDTYAWDKTSEYFNELIEISKKQNISLLILNIPALKVIETKEEYYMLKDNALKMISAKLGIQVLDLIETNISKEHYFPINQHFNIMGNNFAAKKLFEYLNKTRIL